METSGLILDVYDDSEGTILSTIYVSQEEVPDMVKSASRLTTDDLGKLPDDVFALVAVTDGDVMLRKFACVDPGNTVLSIEYFLRTVDKLPEVAQKLAATNLVRACGWYDLEPPETLTKLALGVGAALAAAVAVPEMQGAHAGVKENVAAIKRSRPGSVVNPFKKHGMISGNARAMTPPPLQPNQAANSAPMAAQSSPSAMASDAAKPPPTPPTTTNKMAEVSYTPAMPASATSKNPLKRKAPIKLAGTGHLIPGHGGEKDVAPETESDPSASAVKELHEKVFRGGIDLRGKTAPVKRTEKVAQHLALGRYPMDDYVQIKTAAAWFDEYSGQLPPEHRREFCELLVKRADAIGQPKLVSYDARKYGSYGYAPMGEMKMAMDARKSLLLGDENEENRAAYDGLLEKVATVPADVFCAALGMLDEEVGLHHSYDNHVPDPFWSTHGTEKIAMLGEKEDELHSFGTETISTRQLKESADVSHRNSILGMLYEKFTKEFRDEWQKDPITIFMSLPVEQKTFLARYINDNGVSATDA